MLAPFNALHRVCARIRKSLEAQRSSTSRTTKRNRSRPRTRLGLEALETRELLSANALPPDAVLPAANQNLVTNALATAVAGDGTVYALEQNQTLYNASQDVQISSNVTSIKGSADAIFYRTSDGSLYQVGANSSPVASDVSSYVVTTTGQVYYDTTSPSETSGSTTAGGTLDELNGGQVSSGVTALVSNGQDAYLVRRGKAASWSALHRERLAGLALMAACSADL